MRTSIELKLEHRSRLLALAAQRGEKGFSALVGDAVDAYLKAQGERERRRRRALNLRGTLKAKEARSLRQRAAAARKDWR